jgi:DNA-directed RNA polymerase subunit F
MYGKRMNIMEKLLGFLSVLLGLLAVWEAKRTDILVKTEDERAKNLVRELGEMTKETQKMIERMDKRHQETMEYLGSLIKADGEKTRELINKVIEKIPG